MKRLVLAAICLCATIMFTVVAQSVWHTDILGYPYMSRSVWQADDYSGSVRSTIVKYDVPVTDSDTMAVLYIHGFNDYFFQTEMAERFAEHHYRFYAVDLRKYGRSLMPGQCRTQVRNLEEYFADIDSALADMIITMPSLARGHVVLMGHSTGGLIASYYMSRTHDDRVGALVLNSPFLDWNLGKLECLVPLISAMGSLWPSLPIRQSYDPTYGESLLSMYHGEWSYNTEWKSMRSPDVTAGWIHAIHSAQQYLRHHPYSITVPTLTMFSSRSYSGGDQWSEDAQVTDAVLDVRDIERYGTILSAQGSLARVAGGMHDLVLSKPNVRTAVYRYMFDWLKDVAYR